MAVESVIQLDLIGAGILAGFVVYFIPSIVSLVIKSIFKLTGGR